jgi:uncharacterized Zn finger protein
MSRRELRGFEPKADARKAGPQFRAMWTDWLGGYPIGSERLNKGLEIARKPGKVSELRIDRQLVMAEVKGTQPAPYRVAVEFVPLGLDAWTRLKESFAESPDLLAAFERGEIPSKLESLFAEAGVPFLPERYKHVKTSCTCPDWLRPCKHAIAVLHQLGKQLAVDPLLLLNLRGANWSAGSLAEAAPEVVVEEFTTLALDPATFYGEGGDYGFLEKALQGEVKTRRLLHRLGPLELFGTRMDLERFLESTYAEAGEAALIQLNSLGVGSVDEHGTSERVEDRAGEEDGRITEGLDDVTGG